MARAFLHVQLVLVVSMGMGGILCSPYLASSFQRKMVRFLPFSSKILSLGLLGKLGQIKRVSIKQESTVGLCDFTSLSLLVAHGCRGVTPQTSVALVAVSKRLMAAEGLVNVSEHPQWAG